MTASKQPSAQRAPEPAVRKADSPAPVAARAPQPAPAPAAPVRRVLGDRTEERVRMSKRRATIAKRLVEAQHTAAMLTTFNEVDMTAVMALRARRKEAFQKRYGVGLGLSSFFVKASVGGLRAFPRLNAEVQGDEMVLKHYYDVGIAVGASQGLVRARAPRRGSDVVRRNREHDPRFRKACRGWIAHARRAQGRHVHDHQRRRIRIAPLARPSSTRRRSASSVSTRSRNGRLR